MSINPDLLAQLQIATQQIQQSQKALTAIRDRIQEGSASPEVVAYLDGVYELLTLTARATSNLVTGLQQESGERHATDDYQY